MLFRVAAVPAGCDFRSLVAAGKKERQSQKGLKRGANITKREAGGLMEAEGTIAVGSGAWT
jgi:hypothetical protein